MEEMKQQFSLFLQERKENFISNWKQQIIIQNDDPYKHEIIKNGLNLLGAFIKYINGDIGLQEIEMISKKIAQERIEAKVNISEFIYNTNVGKKEIMIILPLLNPSIQQYQELAGQVDKFFEHLIYFTVYSYYEIKG